MIVINVEQVLLWLAALWLCVGPALVGVVLWRVSRLRKEQARFWGSVETWHKWFAARESSKMAGPVGQEHPTGYFKPVRH